MKSFIKKTAALVGIFFAFQNVAIANTVKIAILDSGIDVKHEIFKDTKILSGWNYMDNSKDITDYLGHGTHIAGIIAKNADDIIILPYKITDKDKAGKLSQVVKALNDAARKKVDIVHMSIGFSKDTPELKKAIQKLVDDDVIVIASAGNKRSDQPFYPAYYKGVLSVGAVDSKGNRLRNSNFGVWVDIFERGFRILSSLPGNQYGYKTGTSEAAAFVTAKVANCFNDYNCTLRRLGNYPNLIRYQEIIG